MSDAAKETMVYIGQQYIQEDFPSPQVWWFQLPHDHPGANELRALGLIEMVGTRQPAGRRWRVTSAGQGWIMTNRASLPSISDATEPDPLAPPELLKRLAKEYQDRGSPPLGDCAWTPSDDWETKAFEALLAEGFVERHRTHGKWQLTSLGLREALRS